MGSRGVLLQTIRRFFSGRAGLLLVLHDVLTEERDSWLKLI